MIHRGGEWCHPSRIWKISRSLLTRRHGTRRSVSGVEAGAKDPSPSMKPTPLARKLRSQMLYTGPVTVSEFMQQCLTHPAHGYYTTRENVFGSSGDFITAPDITPVFPELIGVCISNYLRQNSPSRSSDKLRNLSQESFRTVSAFRLVEFGPGNGSMLKTLLPTLSRLKCMPSSVVLVDASPKLRQKQSEVLDALQDIALPDVTWRSSVSEAAELLDDTVDVDGERCATIIIAHEFLDALPVHVFHRVASEDGKQPLARQWAERLIDVSPSVPLNETESGPLRFVLSPRATPASALLQTAAPSADETVLELCPQAQSLVRKFGRVIGRDGGLALLIDYGGMERRGGTVRALERHAPADLLNRPGEHDITADVDFGTLRRVVEQDGEASFIGAVSQRNFLLRLGAANRFRVLAKNIIDKGGDDAAIDQKLKRLQQDYHRIAGVGGDSMGDVYKVAAVCPKGAIGLAGFEDAPK